MTAVRKFLFDTSFDAAGQAQTASELTPARPAPEPVTEPAAAPNEAELEAVQTEAHAAGFAEGEKAGHAAGFAEGRETGHAEARQAGAHLAAETLGGIERRLETLLAQHEEARTAARDLALQVVRAAFAKLFPRFVEQHGLTEIEALLTDCLARLGEEPRVVVRVADGLYDELDGRLTALSAKAGFEGRIVLLSEPSLASGDLRVEWADGGAERSAAALAAEIDAILQDALSGAEEPQAPTDDPAVGLAAASEPSGPQAPADEPLEG